MVTMAWVFRSPPRLRCAAPGSTRSTSGPRPRNRSNCRAGTFTNISSAVMATSRRASPQSSSRPIRASSRRSRRNCRARPEDMTVTPPRALAPKITNIWTANPAGGLEYEIAHEKASTLGRLGRALEASLDALRPFDAAVTEASLEVRRERRALVAQAGHALWLFVVQREA